MRSINEPGTQLTIRTFHGRLATAKLVKTDIRATMGGTVELRDCNEVTVKDEDSKDVIVASSTRQASASCSTIAGAARESTRFPYGAEISVAGRTKVKKGDQLVRWDPRGRRFSPEKGRLREVRGYRTERDGPQRT
ncbi:MAG: hypothetical protein H6812_11750 [Phycisphaeraceae bacterium]|nr:hypothetical protein [Phycisphaeraceae bacterium]